MQFGPHPGAGTKDQQADRFATIAERHHKQTGSSVLATFFVAHHGIRAVVDLSLLAGCGPNNPYGLSRLRAAQFSHEALDRLIAAVKAVLANHVLPDGHVIAPATY